MLSRVRKHSLIIALFHRTSAVWCSVGWYKIHPHLKTKAGVGVVEHMLTCTSSPAPQSQTVFIPQLSVPTRQPSRTAKPRSRLHICSTFKNEKLTGLLHQDAKSFPLSGRPQHGDEGTRHTYGSVTGASRSHLISSPTHEDFPQGPRQVSAL